MWSVPRRKSPPPPRRRRCRIAAQLCRRSFPSLLALLQPSGSFSREGSACAFPVRPLPRGLSARAGAGPGAAHSRRSLPSPWAFPVPRCPALLGPGAGAGSGKGPERCVGAAPQRQQAPSPAGPAVGGCAPPKRAVSRAQPWPRGARSAPRCAPAPCPAGGGTSAPSHASAGGKGCAPPLCLTPDFWLGE